MIALILAGGTLHADAHLRARIAGADLVVAADGGLRHAATLEVAPDLLVGDMDSVRAEDLERWPDVPRQRHPPAKDALDLELAIDSARDRGAEEVRVVGAFGGRLDQTLAAALIAVRYAGTGLRISLLDGRHDAYALGPGDGLALTLPEGTPFSILSVGEPATVDVHGAAYPLDAGVVPPGVGLGVSNAARGGPRVHVRAGHVLAIVEWAS